MVTSTERPGHMTSLQYRPDVDGLRAVAVLSVVLFHAFPQLIRGGFIGVDIFFVISGFLITSLILTGLEKNRFSFVEFYSRRIRRIFPVLLVILIACYAFGWFALLSFEYKQLGKHIASGAAFIVNVVLWHESGYFNNAADTKPLLHLWTLGVEEQYYILWPMLLWFAWKQKFNLLNVTLLIGFVSFLINIARVDIDEIETFYLPHSRFWELMAGSALAIVSQQKPIFLTTFKPSADSLFRRLHFTEPGGPNFSTIRNLLGTLGFLLILIGFALISKRVVFPGWWALLPVAGTVLVIAAGAKAWLNRVVLSNRALVWLGLISYPLYLWHWPLLSFARIVSGRTPAPGIRITLIAAAILLAWMSMKLVENKLRYGNHGYAKSAMLVALMALIGLVGYYTYAREGLGFRNGTLEIGLQQFSWPTKLNETLACREKYHFLSAQYCNVTDIAVEPTAAIIGDSHANHFFWGLSEYYKKHGGNLINLGAGGCPPFFGVDRGPHPLYGRLNCYKRTKPMYDYVLHDRHIRTVFLAFHHSEYFRNDVEFIDKLHQISGPDNYQNMLSALKRTIHALEKNGKKVVLIYDLPDLKYDIKDCIKLRPLSIWHPDCKLDNSIFVQDYGQYQRMITEVVKQTPVQVFDTKRYLTGNFPIDADGVPNYRDRSHLSVHGSMFFADKYSY